MRFKVQNKRCWHLSFCLFPRKVEGHYVWLERVWRRKEYREIGWEGYLTWCYKLKENQ